MRAFKLLILACCLVTACTEIFEEELEDEKVVIIAPNDGLTTDNPTITFWWEKNELISEYELQIVSRSFEDIRKLWHDTVIKGEKFVVNLNPGDYEWRIRGINSAYQTPYVYRTLSIDSTLDLSQATVTLIKPSENDTSASPEQKFTWTELYNAELYDLEISRGVQGNVILDEEVTTGSYTHDLEQEGAYFWRVRARNSHSSSSYSEASFYKDTTAPGQPDLTGPDHNASLLNNHVNFSWNRHRKGGSSVRDSLYVAGDSLFTSVEIAEETGSTEYADSSLAQGVYFWRVRSTDKAGNKSPYSAVRRFTIQQ